jgi:hypothetical protein
MGVLTANVGDEAGDVELSGTAALGSSRSWDGGWDMTGRFSK